jgi:hypothetical protein
VVAAVEPQQPQPVTVVMQAPPQAPPQPPSFMVPAATAPIPVPEATAKVDLTEKEIVPTGYAIPPTGGHEEGIKRRSYADVSAKSCYGHAEDYSWIKGELQFGHARNAWRVRFASIDEEDRYGGSVTLTEEGPMEEYKDGQLVHIEGRLVDPESRDPSPEYRVRAIMPLNP